ncbi:MAG: PEP/pyruvate-binding domain-containing protein [Actinomycetota bacterium]|nr:PEP/pyruvate-binding domain-containing protein [Actinomycetota bacterium]
MLLPLTAYVPEEMGPKAAMLARLASSGLPVPEGFVVPASVYLTHVRGSGLLTFIESRLRELGSSRTGMLAAPAVDSVLAEVRRAIIAEPLDAALATDISELHAAMRKLPVAVRSSSLAEDLASHSFAGQHGTYFATSTNETLERVKHCWASLWSISAFQYRVRAGIAHENAAMAVIVQRLVPAEAAGVAFTADPVSGARRVIVESCVGLGEGVVSGKVTPDRHIFSLPDLELLDRSVTRKDIEVAVTEDERSREHFVTSSRAERPAIHDATALAVARMSLRAEKVIGTSADVEWAYETGQLWVLQARPITTIDVSSTEASPGDDSASRTVWSNLNTGEILPDVITPMTWSVIYRFVQELFDGLFGDLGVRIDARRVIGLVAGRAYFNLSLISRSFRALPFASTMDAERLLGGMQSYIELPPDALSGNTDEVLTSRWRLVVGVPRLMLWAWRFRPRRARRFTVRLRQTAHKAIDEVSSGIDEANATALADGLVGGLETISGMLGFAGMAMVQFSSLSSACRRWLDDTTGSTANGLLAGQGGLASAEAGRSMWDLGAYSRVHPTVEDILADAESWSAAREMLEASGTKGSESATIFLGMWDEFMNRHGHHSRGEFEFANPRWRDRPDYVLTTVLGYLEDMQMLDPRRDQQHRAEEARALESSCARRIRNPMKRAAFARLTKSAREGAATRENVKSEGVRYIYAIRITLLALGARLAERGVVGRADDIWFLRWDEVEQVRTGEIDARPIIARRRAEDARNRSVTPPPVVIGEWDAGEKDLLRVDSDGEFTGLGVARGTARGPARVIRDAADDQRVLPGEILVAPYADPGWAPLFLTAAGIVVDMGGLLSHGSIIAREYGIPTVVNVGPATHFIRTGDIVEVDGDAGIVRVVEPA